MLRALASQGIFEETTPRTFGNSRLSRSLRTGEPGSVRALFLFFGTELYYRSLGEILYSIQTGEPARAKLLGMSEWEDLRQHPEWARTCDDAMTIDYDLTGAQLADSHAS